MSNNCRVSFYTGDKLGGSAVSYENPMGKQSGVLDSLGSHINGIESLVTGSQGWLVVYSDSDYGGDWLKVGPGTTIDDLEDKQRGSKGDWKNQIQSFVLYSEKPSFWDNSTDGGPKYELDGCKAAFFANSNYDGDNITFLGPTTISDLSSYSYPTNFRLSANDNFDSIRNGSGCWLVIYDDANFSGNYLRIYPNTNYSDLNNVTRGSSDDWKNQISSLQLYNQLPASWVLSFDQAGFRKLFPDNYDDNTVSGDAFGYVTQDAQYRIYNPVLSFPTVDTLVLTIVIDHIISMSTDDHVTLNLTYKADGSLSQVAYSWDAGSAYQIPDKVIKAVDATAAYYGAIGVLATVGISQTAADTFITVFDTACKAFNDISGAMNKWLENDGGRFYMIAVVSQVIARASASIVVS